MKIVLDIEAIHYPLTGIGRYVLSIARELKKSPLVQDVKFVAAGKKLNCESEDDLERYVATMISQEK